MTSLAELNKKAYSGFNYPLSKKCQNNLSSQFKNEYL